MDIRNSIGFGDSASARIRSRPLCDSGLKLSGVFELICRDALGHVRWKVRNDNIVVNTGIDYILGTAVFDGATLYLGLLGNSPTPLATWTMTEAASAEVAGYDEATRPLWGQDSVASRVVTNGTAVDFTMNGDDTGIGGAFLTTDSTKDGTSGTLIAATAFTGGNRTVADNDTVSATYSLTGSSS